MGTVASTKNADKEEDEVQIEFPDLVWGRIRHFLIRREHNELEKLRDAYNFRDWYQDTVTGTRVPGVRKVAIFTRKF